ncbi:MAG: 2-hydroxyglutaryl-CoA dehydratase [Proteobacteria bacterium]|nr:2-hydroxyglutaryl-CoA dehydratase [Pseudomonadota bacterium]
MTITAGVDIGSTYTKAVLFDGDEILAKAIRPTGFLLTEIARTVFEECLATAEVDADDVAYTIATGIGRHQCDFKDLAATDLTANGRGANFLFPGTRTVLDIGGQTMKAIRVDERGKVKSFRLNDKCAAGTGAFLEKTARYMGYSTEEIGPLMTTSRESVPISGVCAVFAESEVINHLSIGTPPCDIMQGAIESLTGRSVQLMKRAKAEPEFTLVGGILRFDTMAQAVRDRLQKEVNVPEGDLCQYTAALGASILAQQRAALAATGGTARGVGVRVAAP